MNRLRLFFLSFLILFTELTLIRFIPGYIRLMGFFANITLIGAFLGMGLGLLWTQKSMRLINWFPLTLLITVIFCVAFPLDVHTSSGSVIFFYDVNAQTAPHVEPTFILPILFVLTALTIMGIAHEFGRTFKTMPALTAYTVDIAGALAGVILFSLLSLAHATPFIWITIISIITVFLTATYAWAWVLRIAIPLVVTCIITFAASVGSLWSPYYRINFVPLLNGIGVYVNAIPNQLATHWQNKEPFYRIPYEEFKHPDYRRILILGSGTGNDIAVARALNPGFERIDAVEIDPTVASLGKTYHPDKPFDDPRVHVTIQDGRNFLARSTQQYDLIIYALTDSLVLTSQTANVRLESYLFTEEGLRAAKHHLASDGLIVLYNYYRQPWLVDKIAQMAERAIGSPVYYYIFEKQSLSSIILAGPKLTDINDGSPLATYQTSAPESPATDDWPFLYIRYRSLPVFYTKVLLLLAVASFLLIAPILLTKKDRRLDMRFLLFGAAFLLLETKSLATFSLLFGATWYVNALVIAAILVSILGANLISMKYTIPIRTLYILLFISLGASYLLPAEKLLSVAEGFRYISASVVYFAPVFFANMIFSQQFKRTHRPVMSLASNILGAVLGGLIEYSAMMIGYHALYAVIACCYGMAIVVSGKNRYADY